MHETLLDSRSELARPRTFLRRALRDLRASPRVAWHLFRANLRAGRRRSLFGYLWLLLPAVSATAVSVYLQGREIVAVGATELPYALHVLAGMVLWQTFLDALNAPQQHLAAARQIVTRSALPHEAILLAGLFEVGLNAAVRVAVLVAFIVLAGHVPVTAGWMIFPLGMLALATLGSAVGLAVAPLGLLYDDVRRGVGVVATFWFFLTPVLYAAPTAGALTFNPVTPLLDGARRALVAPEASWGFVATAGAAAIFLILSWLGYRLARPHVIERLG